jgi:two-component system, LuxR family, response regulator FixJ
MTETVFIVDDDAGVRDSLALLLHTAGFAVETFSSAEAYLQAFDPLRPGCLVLDVRMPQQSGPQLQRALVERGRAPPIIFLTAYGDIPTTVRAMRDGAFDFLTKPIEAPAFVERVRAALAADRRIRELGARQEKIDATLAALTQRERDVLALAIEGLPNKEIGRRLGISHRTVEVHRSRILLKTGESTLLGLARLTGAAAVAPGLSPPGRRLGLPSTGEVPPGDT